MIRERVPGKLFIAGEYAVVASGEPSVLVAVDRFITVDLTESEGVGTVFSEQYGRLPMVWMRDGERVILDPGHQPLDYVFSAITTVEQLVAERRIAPRFYDIRISSELDDNSGRKFGLGSSAAVAVAIVRALDRFYGLGLADLEVYKVALIATVRVSPAASGGDVAACTFGGWIAYSAPDRVRMLEEWEERGMQAMLEHDWPGLAVRRLPEPAGLSLVVGWTGQPASTGRLVDSVQHRIGPAEQPYQDFLAESRTAVTSLIASIEAGDAAGAMVSLREARTALGNLAHHSDLEIETPALLALVGAAEAVGAAAKSSGAGGGDCGIVLAPESADLHLMLRSWEQHDIRYLDISSHPSRSGRAGDVLTGAIRVIRPEDSR